MMSVSADLFPEKRCTVLLVDDVRDSREMYAFFLRASGYSVHEAADGGDALAMAREFHPDVIVMDLSLPSVDGWTAIASLAEHPDTGTIPVVVLSAHTFPADEERARVAGAAAYLHKPCPPDDLARTVRAVSEGCDRAFSAVSADIPAPVSTAPRTGPTPAP
jgi:two-component system, cell cycle response regulator DivK